MKVGYYRHDHGSGNFGDELGPVIAQAMLGRPVEKSNDMSQPVFSVIGSISQNLAPGSHVWGSGIMLYQLQLIIYTFMPLEVHAPKDFTEA